MDTIDSSMLSEDPTHESLNIDWTSSDDEDEAAFDPGPSCSSSTKAFHEFVNMGFSVEVVQKAFMELGRSSQVDEETMLNALLRYSRSEHTRDSKDKFKIDAVSDSEGSNFSLGSFTDEDETSVDQEYPDSALERDHAVSALVEMGYEAECALAAIDRCGIGTPLLDLIDMMDAAAMAHDDDILRGESSGRAKKRGYPSGGKRKLDEAGPSTSKKQKAMSRGKQPMYHDDDDDDDERLCLPNPMIGFGVPNDLHYIRRTDRNIPSEARGRPYIYYENIANTPAGVWQTISRFLYGIQPEFVDSKYLSAACRKRGYIHNLPIHNRFQVLPACPKTIHEALPQSKEHWPSWDRRTLFNCILTSTATAPMTDAISAAVDMPGGPSAVVIGCVLKKLKRWNLVWCGKNKVAPLEPDEIEKIMGFRVGHTRGGGVTRTDRFRLLGNTFQVDTVAYHLSVLKSMFPDGINVLSLFSGIGGAEVALHRLGIPLKNVVSVEVSEACRKVLRSWWIQTNQQGKLTHFHDVRLVTHQHLQTWVSEMGGFDLIIGGSPCDNLAGVNRATRTGLDGEKSILFYEFHRIVNAVRSLMNTQVVMQWDINML